MTAADRAAAERTDQGLATPAAPVGDDDIDGRTASAYRATASVLASATPTDSSASRRGAESVGIGAAGTSSGKWRSPARSSKKKAPAATGALHDNSGHRTAAGEA